ncbi:MAG TPA: ATP-dependent DNA helicase [Candidatus Nanopelagicaceae bacterium]
MLDLHGSNLLTSRTADPAGAIVTQLMLNGVVTNGAAGLVGPLVRQPLLTKSLAFTDEQMRAIAHRGSPLVVLGGPGTGKTTFLIEAALSRISNGQDPNSILLLTYGRERAAELRDAVALRTTAVMHEPIARTFHSLAFSILKMRANVDDPEPILMSGPEQDYFIRELLLGDIAMGKNYWPADLQAALSTHGFSRELRDLILRASERNLSPQRLVEFGREFGEKYWEPAATFWQQYLDVMDLQTDSAGDAKRRIDPSQIVIEAYRHLKNHQSLAFDLRSRFTTILVDEFQESDPAQRKLLREITGTDAVLCADGDSAVGRFRGADPDQLSVELDHYLSGATPIVFHDVFRNAPKIFEIGVAVASEFRGTAPQRNRRSVFAEEESNQNPVVIGRFRSHSEEAQFIAYQLRYAHLIENKPWREMAVILRSTGAQASALRRAFNQVGIPVASETEALSDNPAIAPFLLLAQIALREKELTAENCERLLLSEFGGADSVSLRRIRRSLIAARSEEDTRTGAELLVSALDKGEISIEGGQSLQRIHDLLLRARKILRRVNVQGEDLLWEIWSNALTSDGELLRESWRRQALRGGSRGAAADRDLDAMMALFETARRFAERFPYSGAGRFIAQITQEDILGDVITAKGQRPDVVEILTVHTSKGREWEVVAVAGIQEGVWPNLRQRGSLLGSERLVERMRHGGLARKELDVLAASGLLEDERRLFHVAVTRAKSHLILSAVAREDDEPSTFFEEISFHLLGESDDEPSMTSVPRPITPAALVATLRNELKSAKPAIAASILRRLDAEGITEADVNSWSGVLPLSTSMPVVSEGTLVPVSPSSAESFTECGVKWFLERSGGTNGDSPAQVLGSAIHAFAALLEEDPSLTEEDLVEKLRKAWNLIDPNTGWVSNAQLVRAIEMLHKFVKYHSNSLNQVIGVEAEFQVVIGRAKIRGSVDRLEVTVDGDLFIVDFKTGSNPISKTDAITNKQMQAYQLAITEGGFANLHASRTSAGAELVYLGYTSVDATVRSQPPVETDVVKGEIESIAAGMSGNDFFATINKRCNFCHVRSSCPIQSDGRAVME